MKHVLIITLILTVQACATTGSVISEEQAQAYYDQQREIRAQEYLQDISRANGYPTSSMSAW